MFINILEKIFGSANRVKILRLFFLNPNAVLTSKEIAEKIKASRQAVSKEILMLGKIAFVKKKVQNKKEGWNLNPSFLLFSQLKRLILNAAPISYNDILRKLKPVGRLKLVIVSGIFMQEGDDSRIDLFIVADAVNRKALNKVLKDLESKIGKELEYAILSSRDFQYRMGVYDKFIRDVLDLPHKKILNKMNI